MSDEVTFRKFASARTRVRRALSPIVAAATLWIGIGVGQAGEYSQYSYKLVSSKDDAVCRHMNRLYESRFRSPFDPDMRTKIRGESKVPSESRYPSSPEFDAIRWKVLRPMNYLADTKGRRHLMIAEFDIDNDGTSDIVAKDAVFDLTPNGFEQFVVFAKHEFDLGRTGGGGDVVVGQRSGARPRIVSTGAAISRPFVLRDIVYLSDYYFAREEDKSQQSVFLPPEFMRVHKYLGGGYIRSASDGEARLEEVCVFRMIVRR